MIILVSFCKWEDLFACWVSFFENVFKMKLVLSFFFSGDLNQDGGVITIEDKVSQTEVFRAEDILTVAFPIGVLMIEDTVTVDFPVEAFRTVGSKIVVIKIVDFKIATFKTVGIWTEDSHSVTMATETLHQEDGRNPL